MRLFLLFLMMNAAMAYAQTKLSYAASIEAGFLQGNSDKSSAFLFSNGVSYKNVTTGFGVGIDNYLFRSVPLFLMVKKDFGHRRAQPFVNASVGININAVKDSQKGMYNWWYDDVKFKNGFFTEASAGASLKVSHKLRVFASFGYSYKTTRVTYGSYIVSPGLPPNSNTDIYRQNRWCFATGICF